MKRVVPRTVIGIRWRGELITAKQVISLRGLIRSNPQVPRSEIAVLACKRWGWRRAGGELRLRACADLLLRLEKKDWIVLPKPRGGARRPRSKDEVATPVEPARERAPALLRESLNDIDLREVLVREVERSEMDRWRAEMDQHHYLGAGNIVGECVRHVALSRGRWVALLGWGSAALKIRHREQYVGWDARTKYQRLHLVANNVRFLVLPEARMPHLASRVLSRSLRRLSSDWEKRYGHAILLAETFVDFARFRGTCYRAANWIYLGQTRGMARKGAGFVEHGRKKGLFVYALHRRAKEILAAPFPSPAVLGRQPMETNPIDVNSLPLDGKGGLIELLRDITDTRSLQGKRYPLESVLALATMATLSGARSYTAIWEWARDLPKPVLRGLHCWCHRAPSESTFRRVLQSANIEEIDARVGEWLAGRVGPGPIALDGKALRGSATKNRKARHLLSAITHAEGVVLAQEEVPEKSNEIPGAKVLLEDLDLRGVTVTADALHTQKDFACYLVEKKDADFVLIAKGNQPKLQSDIKDLDWGSFPPSRPND